MRNNQLFLPASKRLDVEIEYGKGVYLYDQNGKAYLDCLSGMGVNALGHQHPAIQSAITKQMNRNLHLFGYFYQEQHYELAELLLRESGFDRLFYCNSGTEAMEGALKLIKKWGNQHQKHEIVSFYGGFHGRTLGALSITAQPKKQKPFEPLLANVIALNKSIDELKTRINENTACVILELILGEGGIVPTDPAFVEELICLRDRFGFKIIVDEIQSGMGRSGKLFSYQLYDFQPDMITVAKGLGGGLPLGALLIKEDLAFIFDEGEHGTTFGGNPLAVATGLATLNEILSDGFLQNVIDNGKYFKMKLEEIRKEFPDKIKEIRQIGLMIGVEVGDNASKVMKDCLAAGLIVNATQGHTVRLLPPLIISKSEIDKVVVILSQVLEKLN